jgi:ribonucleotide reductase alpha subunit
MKEGESALKIERFFTQKGQDPFETVQYVKRDCRITNPDGSVVYEMKGAEIPESWSQVAADIMISKYFRKAGVPQTDSDGNPILDEDGNPVTGPEKSAKQVIHRLAGCWREWGERYGYFDTPEDGQAFYDELVYMLLHQMAAPNSPQWFNTGLAYAYGITGKPQGHYYVDPETEELKKGEDAYSRPQPHACFIQSVEDDLVNENGIMDLWVREARLFKYGSGTGTNFSNIRGKGEPLSGGGTSSGLLSFLKIGDRAAGAIKSGGTTRRAAKMVTLDLDHPDIEEFINWKSEEEKKVRALIAAGYDPSFNGEAYETISGQNSNNSVRVPHSFFKALDSDGSWDLTRRTDGKVAKTVPARDLWRQIGAAAWECADPGVQYDGTINEWHTCPAGMDGNRGARHNRINGSNPCVTGDTLVATVDGWKRMDSLIGKNPWLMGRNGEKLKAKAVFPTGRKQVYQLETQSGYTLKLTEDHQVYTLNRGDVPAKDLRTGDRLILAGAGFGKETIDREMAESIGLAVGDGCTAEANRETVAVTMGAPVLETEVANRHTSGVHTVAGNDSRIAPSTPEIHPLVKRYAVLNLGSEEKQLTDAVFSLDQASVAGILRGLFTSDGTVVDTGDNNHELLLESPSLTLLKQVQTLLLSFGIKAKLDKNCRTAKVEVELADGCGGHKVKPLHSLRICRSSHIRFRNEIGFLASSPKAEALRELKENSIDRNRLEDPFKSLTPLGVEPVYDLTEPVTSHFVADGIYIHNCSEYMFLDNTACNLASLNLVQFFDKEKARFHIPALQHASRLWTIVLEISVLMAQYPSKEIAKLSFEYRTLGLGYANIGTVLMISGIPYDSDRALAITGAVTAIMTGTAYATSAEMAKELGPFKAYPTNREHMLRVIRNHRRAAYHVPDEEYEGLTIQPMGIHPTHCPPELLEAARASWDQALEWGEKYGYRNAQTTLLAPTGTIGLLMDCDTTGVEPDFALVKFKKLAGGGYFKIANQSIRPALKNLGYSPEEIADILAYVTGTLRLDGAPHINRESLKEKGLTDEELDRVEESLPSVFELSFAFNSWTLGEDCLKRLGFTEEQYQAPDFNFLRAIGFTRAQIEEAGDVICGCMTTEGAPHLKEEHYPVFDTANPCGKRGKRFIHYMGHLRMMAAAQPFLSGAISKTINMPHESTVEDIQHAYLEGWKLGLKAVALYRDGSKSSQPLNSRGDDQGDGEETEEASVDTRTNLVAAASQIKEIYAKGHVSSVRRRLPSKREGITQEARIAGHKIFVRTGEYEDGTLGEIFIDMHKAGSTMRGMVDAFAIAVSLGLQHGVPLEKYVNTMTFTRFEPAGTVNHPNIKMATSVVDYVFRLLGMEYLGRTDFVQVPPKQESLRLHANRWKLEKHEHQETVEQKKTPEHASSEVDQAFQEVTGGRETPRDNLEAIRASSGAPLCIECGGMTKRNGSCYVCLDCGATTGCS